MIDGQATLDRCDAGHWFIRRVDTAGKTWSAPSLDCPWCKLDAALKMEGQWRAAAQRGENLLEASDKHAAELESRLGSALELIREAVQRCWQPGAMTLRPVSEWIADAKASAMRLEPGRCQSVWDKIWQCLKEPGHDGQHLYPMDENSQP